MFSGGYQGKYLRINLTNRTIKEEKINPLGGCLPILIQIPVFIALYWALLESVELRHAPFMLWIKDLSAMDPFFVLPLIMMAKDTRGAAFMDNHGVEKAETQRI